VTVLYLHTDEAAGSSPAPPTSELLRRLLARRNLPEIDLDSRSRCQPKLWHSGEKGLLREGRRTSRGSTRGTPEETTLSGCDDAWAVVFGRLVCAERMANPARSLSAGFLLYATQRKTTPAQKGGSIMRRIALIVLAIATLLLSTGTTIAGHGDDKPGWGFGAGGHSGPPGQGCPCDVVGPPP